MIEAAERDYAKMSAKVDELVAAIGRALDRNDIPEVQVVTDTAAILRASNIEWACGVGAAAFVRLAKQGPPEG
jgi:hypothetical protein